MSRLLMTTLAVLAFAASPAHALTPMADLQVTQVDSPDPVAVGGTITYTITIRNNGPDPATSITVMDTLPFGTTFLGDSMTGGGVCTPPSGGPVSCALASLSSGGSAILTLQVQATTPGIVTNGVNVGATTPPDPNPANNMSSESTTVLGNDGGSGTADSGTTTADSGTVTSDGSTMNLGADVSITKTDSPDPVARGGRLTYTLSVQNAGPQTATGVGLDDFLPAGVTLVGTSGGAASNCSYDGGTRHLVCALPDLAAGSGTSMMVQVDVSQPGTLTNTANVHATSFDPNTANNSSTATTTVGLPADLAVTIVGAPNPVQRGGTLTYTITATNNGPGVVIINLIDQLPSGLTYTSNSQPGSCAFDASGVVHCAGVKLDPGASFVVTVTVTVNVNGTISNTAAVSGDVPDPTPGNNSATAQTTVTPVTDLSVTKSASPASVTVGGAITYTVVASNAGPSAASNVRIVDSLPAGVALSTVTQTQGSCASPTASSVQCSFGTLAPGQSATVTLVVKPSAAGTIVNSVTVAGNESDPAAGNNTATASTTVNPAPMGDLSITKQDSSDPVLVNTPLTYTITVSNSPAAASGVVVSDPLPAGVSFVSASSTLGSCGQAGGTVTCNLGSMSPSQTASITIVVTPTAVSTLSNTATVTASATDPNPANNTATATTDVIGEPVDGGLYDAAAVDGGPGADAAAVDAGREKPALKSGCGCRTGGREPRAGLLGLALLGLVLWRARRRR